VPIGSSESSTAQRRSTSSNPRRLCVGGWATTDEVAYFQDAFDHGCRQALSPKASLDLIQQLSDTGEQRA
jgi:hypothetical protein